MNSIAFSQIVNQYPNQWVLLGNPVMSGTEVKEAILILHNSDKEELCLLGKELIEKYDRVKVVHTSTSESIRHLGYFKRV